MATKPPTFRERLHNKQIELFNDYIDSVLNGKRKAGSPEIAKITRHLNDIERSNMDSFDWEFNWGVAHKALDWMQINLKFPSGDVAGKALKLQPWQVFDIATIFGWVDKRTKRLRRFTTVYWQISRKKWQVNNRWWHDELPRFR
eukprot:TRINITY_DN57770_c0_g1_i1.p3 TRINITY_DN57770_c0_g1~~TRINITY_DN57770_c0_g1_i1.p3  ORF type:complete len:144 (+),score=3.85 TRINITY_DN57770_c0_g1_i1:582-1013(+)